MTQSPNTTKRGLAALEGEIDQQQGNVRPKREPLLPGPGNCFALMCSQAGVEVAADVRSVLGLADLQALALASKRQFKVMFRTFGYDDPRNHIQLVTSFATNFFSSVNHPFDLPNKESFIVCTSMIHFFNKHNQWASYKFYSSIGSAQFFHPTRFPSISGNRRVKFPLAGKVNSTYVSTLSAAESKARELLGSTPVFSLTAEPGTGKTTVLPFSFANSRVAVVLPTGFDAWSAYKTASADANLATLTSSINNSSNVTYFDSYTMAGLLYVHEGKLDYDIVIIDESDSYSGVTRMLTELRIPDISVIHLSGTSDEKTVRSAASYPIEKSYNFPPLHDKFFEAVEYIKQNSMDVRSLVMCPDSQVAGQVHKMIANSKIISENATVDDLQEVFDNQHNNSLIICDDSCTRGFNLNLDVVFDFQYVGAIESRRCITDHEQTQRMMRVGRNKPGVYHAPKHTLGSVSHSQLDVFRNNVARYMFCVPLHPCDLELDASDVYKLAVSSVEPYIKQMEYVASKTPSPRSSAKSTSPSSLRPSTPGAVSKKDIPRWALWAAGCSQKARSASSSSADSVAVSSSDGDSKSASALVRKSYVSPVVPARMGRLGAPASFVDSAAKRVADRPKPSPKFRARPPPIDLSDEHDSIDWPGALADQIESGEPVPFIVPYGGWCYTLDGSSSGVDYIQRLVSIITDGPTFSKAEFEVICRAWNLLAARSGFSFAGGRDAWNDASYITFCLEFFHSFIAIV